MKLHKYPYTGRKHHLTCSFSRSIPYLFKHSLSLRLMPRFPSSSSDLFLSPWRAPFSTVRFFDLLSFISELTRLHYFLFDLCIAVVFSLERCWFPSFCRFRLDPDVFFLWPFEIVWWIEKFEFLSVFLCFLFWN